ncbi:MAG: DUF1592 domain-containing protein [Polyangiaceae bacterium]|nr:DUF1592 domain-containing protein [Polyangiaceae bacterium]
MERDVGRWRRAGYRGAIAALGLMAVAGCTGQLGDNGEGPGPGTPSGEDPGRVTIHRLNRAEYDNTVRDLLGTGLRPAVDFPTDDHAYGFDNLADTLTISPLQLELYERAAELLADDVLTVGALSELDRYEAEEVGGTVGVESGGAWNLFSNGDVTVTQTLASAGTYRVRVRAWQQAAGPDAAQLSIMVGAATFGPFDVTGTEATPQILEQELELDAGTTSFMVSFLNDYYDDVTGEDRNLLVDWIEVEGPIGATGDNPLREGLVICEPATGGAECVRDIVESFGRRAFRRPLEETEIDGLVALYDLAISQGDDETEGLKLIVRAVLTSPHFLFRVEIDQDPTSPAAHPLGAFELASRLSYFLWSSMPDDELLELAGSGALLEDDVLAAQVGRMLDDPRSAALVDNFAGQWLFVRALADSSPTYTAFPTFDEPLREAMRLETNLLFAETLQEGGASLEDLLLADYVFVNDRLAEHYGIDGTFGPELVRAPVGAAPRGGLLRQGAWLTVTSNPDRTSPVKRGKWILENLLCDAPPPPPAGVEGFDPAALEAQTQKELLAAHRADPACASCHSVMDPLGLALENYDGIGAFRLEDKGTAVDPSGEVDGQTFQTPSEFITMLAADERLSQCAVEKVFTYALGRAPGTSDRTYLEDTDDAFRASDLSLRELMKLVVLSEPFRYRRGEPEGGSL